MAEPLASRFPLLEGEHEEVHFFHDPGSGLRALLVIHDTSRGPALGGIRRHRYASEDEAIADAQRLAKGMTRKCALVGLPAGGGKAVILDHDQFDRVAGYRALGERIEAMGGRFFTSGDLGTSLDDLREVAQRTRFVTDPDHEVLGRLGECTAEGLFLCSGVCLDVLGIDSWNKVKIAIQGLGKIGLHLATLAAKAGAEVFAADIDSAACGRAVDTLPLTLVDPVEILSLRCDVFAPCASGGVITPEVAEGLDCRLVAGSANQPLSEEGCAEQLHRRGILFAPDLVSSAGAVVVGCGPGLPGFRPPSNLDGLAVTMREVVVEAMQRGRSPEAVARERADAVWMGARQARAEAGQATT